MKYKKEIEDIYNKLFQIGEIYKANEILDETIKKLDKIIKYHDIENYTREDWDKYWDKKFSKVENFIQEAKNKNMIYKDIERIYGKAVARKIKKELDGVTIRIDDNGTEHYYDNDVYVAYLVVMKGYKPKEFEWD